MLGHGCLPTISVLDMIGEMFRGIHFAVYDEQMTGRLPDTSAISDILSRLCPGFALGLHRFHRLLDLL